MKIIVRGTDGVFEVNEDGQVAASGSDPRLGAVRTTAAAAACGPPLWAGPIEAIRRWASSQGHTLEEVDVPELPSVEGRVY